VIELKNICIRVGDFALENVSFAASPEQYVVVMGQTGSGKTTILESICGLRRIERGQILVQGIDVTNWPPADRQIGYVPQDLAVFPTLTVREHLAFALRLRRVKGDELTSRIGKLASTLGIDHLLHRKVDRLSGGESQRVALGRALSFQPPLLLLDEPLSALDETTRQEMQSLLRKVKETTGGTILHVTHSNEEARALADRCLELVDGQLKEVEIRSL